jgi:hypothetical protein
MMADNRARQPVALTARIEEHLGANEWQEGR